MTMSLDLETRAMMLESADRLLRDLCTPELVNQAEQGEFPDRLWQALEEAGLTLVGVPEEKGGVGGSLADLAAALRLLGAHAVPAPAAETALAQYLGARAGLDLPPGPLSVAIASAPLQLSADGARVSGEIRAVPWAARAAGIVAPARRPDGSLHLVVIGGGQAEGGGNTAAGEPRGRLNLADAQASSAAIDLSAADHWALAAFMRLQQMAGAAQRVLEIALDYARERKQFGRPIGNFQAIQQLLAELAGQVASLQSAAESAGDAAAAGDLGFPIAAAKVRAGESAGRIAAMAHQVLGAMGFTYEHRLHHFTRRLWVWRDDYGGDGAWAAEIGRAVAQAGPQSLWPRLTEANA
ncbi:MAG: acyl-CoA dehydrogenase family protein [Reyranellaceae bacterium]